MVSRAEVDALERLDVRARVDARAVRGAAFGREEVRAARGARRRVREPPSNARGVKRVAARGDGATSKVEAHGAFLGFVRNAADPEEKPQVRVRVEDGGGERERDEVAGKCSRRYGDDDDGGVHPATIGRRGAHAFSTRMRPPQKNPLLKKNPMSSASFGVNKEKSWFFFSLVF